VKVKNHHTKMSSDNSKNSSYSIRCSDDDQVVVQFKPFLIQQCGTLDNLIQDFGNNQVLEAIPVPCTKKLALLVIEYGRLHEEHDPLATRFSSKQKHENDGGSKEIILSSWESKFVEDNFRLLSNLQMSNLQCFGSKDQYEEDLLIFQLLNFANFLEYYELMHFAAKSIAKIIRNHNKDELQTRFAVR
jgi:hypothetical protein